MNYSDDQRGKNLVYLIRPLEVEMRLTVVSLYSELPPSIMMSPVSNNGTCQKEISGLVYFMHSKLYLRQRIEMVQRKLLQKTARSHR